MTWVSMKMVKPITLKSATTLQGVILNNLSPTVNFKHYQTTLNTSIILLVTHKVTRTVIIFSVYWKKVWRGHLDFHPANQPSLFVVITLNFSEKWNKGVPYNLLDGMSLLKYNILMVNQGEFWSYIRILHKRLSKFFRRNENYWKCS